MSGPKVVRIVTREEAIATCERDLQRLDKALARWENQASRLKVDPSVKTDFIRV